MRRHRFLTASLLTASLLMLAPIGMTGDSAPTENQVTGELTRLLAVYLTHNPPSGPQPDQVQRLMQRFYASGGNAPVWAADGFNLARQAMQYLKQAHLYGLEPDDYAIHAAIPDDAEQNPEQLARFDLDLTAAVLRFLSDLQSGRAAPDIPWFGAAWERRNLDPGEQLRTALRQRRLDQAIKVVQPGHALYHRVQETLAQYRQLASRSRQWAPLPPLPNGRAIRPGMAYAGSAGLLERLVLFGDMPGSADAATNGVYNERIEAGVKRFQSRHGLQPDGIIGKATMEALFVPISVRVRQLELTLERLRWMPVLPPGPLIVVNIPSYRLWALDAGPPSSAPPIEMRVIVGTAGRTETPLFIAQLRSLEFNPSWNVPRSIELKEIIPALVRDPDYLRKHDMELVSVQGKTDLTVIPPLSALRAGTVRVRQRPGARNVLGALKFAMPNPLSIYLHATSAQALFAKQRRDLSHGCIRLEQPAELAEFVLRREGGWDRTSVLQAMEPGPTRIVSLDTPVPVILLYATAVTDRQGRALFFQDIYGLDKKLIRDLEMKRGIPLTN